MNKFMADDVAVNLFRHMLSDFRVLHGQDFASNACNAFDRGISSFREYEWPRLGVLHPARFKAWWQLRHLFKTHRFASDFYTDEELEKRSHQGYLDFQQSVQPLNINHPVVFRVVQEARKIAKEILGPFEPEELIGYARFGKRSSIGCGFSKAYIDYKLTMPEAFTSTAQARDWFFNQYLPNDPVMKRIVRQLFKTRKREKVAFNWVCESLALVSVPKSWKTLRIITPLTLLELFYTFAVGGVVTEKLKLAGLDITTLQDRHKVLARLGSLRKSVDIATADLSRASDSILSQLLCAVLPRAWYNALRKAFCRQVEIDGKVYATHTVLPMGNGFTFPVETLTFYCLTKAIGNLTRINGIYSVYGDDCIYPTRLHRYVQKIFPLLGLTLNMEKSYADSFFRESCGGDYYRGCDVRPYIYSAERNKMSRSWYLGHLYQVYNGLQRRWADEELPSTFQWLMREIAQVGGRVLQVPPSFPDYSGVRTDSIQPGKWLVPFVQPKRDFSFATEAGLGVLKNPLIGSPAYAFQHLARRPDRRYVLSTQPYYWMSYRHLNDDDQADRWFSIEDRIPDSILNAFNREVEEIDRWLQHQLKSYATRSSGSETDPMLQWMRVKKGDRFGPTVAKRGRDHMTNATTVITHWT